MEIVTRIQVILFNLMLVAGSSFAADPFAEIPPLEPGPYPVGCSNVAQNFTLAPSDEQRNQYWEGRDGRYVTELFNEAGALRFDLQVPDERSLYVAFAGSSIPYGVIVCYPTARNNPRANYPVNVAGTTVVPKMQRGEEPPIWPENSTRFPLLLYSHGLASSPLASDFLTTITLFASYGYVVAAPFQGDSRFANVRIDNFADFIRLLLGEDFRRAVELQAIRPRSLQTMLDMLLQHPHYRDRLDPQQIGGFGASLGAQSLMLFAGAELTTRVLPGLRSTRVMADSRLKAIVGYVPYFGQRLLPAFGDDQRGLDGMTIPTLVIAGTADTTAPILLTEQGINRLVGARYLVAFEGLTHTIRIEEAPDIFTWTATFLDAYVTDDREARAQMARLERVRGGANDSVRIDYTTPTPPTADERIVTEYFNTNLSHFFITAEAAEVAYVESGGAGPGWMRTGLLFKAWPYNSPSGDHICRFYGTPGRGPNSHFFAGPEECASVRDRDRGWSYEGFVFNARLPTEGNCPPGMIPVYRLYNNDWARNNSNHRYTTSRQTYRGTQLTGWIGEGVAMCGLP